MSLETWNRIPIDLGMHSWLQVGSMMMFVILLPFFSIVSVWGIRRAAATRLAALLKTFPRLAETAYYQVYLGTYNRVDESRYIAPLVFMTIFNLYMTLMLFDGFGTTSSAIEEAKSYFILGGTHCNYIPDEEVPDCTEYEAKTLLTVSFAFMGWMAWTFANIFDRATSLQLFPSTFYRVLNRLVIAVLVVIVMRHLLASDSAYIDVSLPAIAFVVGMFPERAIAFILQQFERFIRPPDHSEDFPLDLIQGISPSLSFRMNELSIDNVVDLAHSNPFSLFDAMAFPMSEIVDWIGQSQLLVLLQPARFEAAQAAGYRTIFDFVRLLEQGKDSDASVSFHKLTNPLDVLANIEQSGQFRRLKAVFDEMNSTKET